MDVSTWQVQLRKGAAELAVLSLVRDRERYGVEILARANADGEIVTEGALYPLLSRLERDGKLATRWVVDGSPHPRKFYRLTSEGEGTLAAMTSAWTRFRTAVSAIVETCP